MKITNIVVAIGILNATEKRNKIHIFLFLIIKNFYIRKSKLIIS